MPVPPWLLLCCWILCLIEIRFSIASGEKNIMYALHSDSAGWVTSHVIVKIKESVAMASKGGGTAFESIYLSNAPELTPENLLKGRLGTIKHFGSKGYQISYSWDSLLIYQRLMPVDSNFNYADNGQYYRISYDLINTSKQRTRELGLTFMLDPNIAGNDNADIRIGSFSLMDTVIFQMPNALDVLKLTARRLISHELRERRSPHERRSPREPLLKTIDT